MMVIGGGCDEVMVSGLRSAEDGSGDCASLSEPFLITIYHTTEAGSESEFFRL